MKLVRTEDEVFRQINWAVEQSDIGGSIYRGCTFEDGVKAALQWVIGEIDDLPIPASPFEEYKE